MQIIIEAIASTFSLTSVGSTTHTTMLSPDSWWAEMWNVVDWQQQFLTTPTSATAKCELHVLGLSGKMFTEPWMKRFNTSPVTSQIIDIKGVGVVKAAVNKLKQLEGMHPVCGHRHMCLVGCWMLRSCWSLQRWWGDEVLENCFCNYEVLQHRPLAEKTQSARSHNIYAEEIKGMFSTLNMKSPNAKLCFLSSKVRSVKHGRRKRAMKRLQQSTINDDQWRRCAEGYPRRKGNGRILIIHCICNSNMYIVQVFERRTEWAVCYRQELAIRGNNTNNFVEAAMRILKDKVVDRVRACNPIQLLDGVLVSLLCLPFGLTPSASISSTPLSCLVSHTHISVAA